jgi:hypothetical protein
LEHLGEVKRLNIAGNTVMVKVMKERVMGRVEEIDMRYDRCQAIGVNVITKEYEIDSEFREIAKYLVN